jgi:hypothetical protein
MNMGYRFAFNSAFGINRPTADGNEAADVVAGRARAVMPR